MAEHELSAERLRLLLDYDPDTGIFTWKVQMPHSRRRAGEVAGGPTSYGYWRIQIDGTGYRAHRLAWLYVYGEWPPCDIDHRNRNPSDNRMANLRLDRDGQNQQNATSHRNSSSGLLGVSWDQRCRRWKAQISAGGKHLTLGRYATPEEAHTAYLEAKDRLHPFWREAS